MKKTKLLAILILSINFGFSSENLKEIRDLYYKVNLEDIGLDDFEKSLNKNIKIPKPELEGYKAILWFLKAKKSYNPYKKYESFNKGKKQLELLIKKYPDNVELHFLRLTIQDHSPIFLGYNDKIEIDEIFIKAKIKELNNDFDLKSRIIEYLNERDK